MINQDLGITRIRISRWAKLCRGRITNGWPTSSAFTHANEGERAYDLTHDLPPDLTEVDQAVASLTPLHRAPLLAFYLSQAPLQFKAAKLRISRRTLMRRVELAERKVHLALSCARPEISA
jgi:DNA-directed RNA polymerase specialized sigma24 family protein